MRGSLARWFVALAAAAGLAAGAALAQDGGDKSRLERLLEGLLSTPERSVSLTGLQGAFSSSPTVELITVADADGPWLEIQGVEVVWNRTALFRRTLDIDSLRAEQVTMLRKPQGGAAEESEAGGLPVDVILDAFTLPAIVVEPPVAGAAARLSAEGSARVTGGTVAGRLAVAREDRPGRLAAEFRLEPEVNVLTADLQFSEPAGGLLAELLNLRNRPSLSLSLAGTGPLDSWTADLQLEADGARVLTGGLAVSRSEAGRRLTGDLAGALETVAPESYAALLAGESRLRFNVQRAADGSHIVQAASLRSAGMDIQASGSLTADFVPEGGELTLRLGQAGRTTVPFAPGGVSVASLQITAGLDSGPAAAWRAAIAAEGVESAFGRAAGLALTARGQASNIADPSSRAASFQLEGSAEGVSAADPALAAALGSTLNLTSSGAWSAGEPVTFEALRIVLEGASVQFVGTAEAGEASGRLQASVTDLSRLSDLAGRPLRGAAELGANGTLGLAGERFDLQLDGNASALGIGVARLDPLLAGTTQIGGGLARGQGGFRFAALTLSNEQVSAELSGSVADPALDLTVEAEIANLSTVTPRAQGTIQVSARVSGTRDAPQVSAEASGAEVVLVGRPLRDASARFAGVVAGPGTGGAAELGGLLGDLPVSGAATLAAGEGGARRIEDLLLEVGDSRVSGDLSIGADGLVTGQARIVSPDLSQVAPLFLAEASGMMRAEVELTAAEGGQAARFSGAATDVVYEGVRLDSAEIAGAGQDLLSAPRIEGTFALRNLVAGGLTVVSASGAAERRGPSTALSVDAQLLDGNASLGAAVEPGGAGLDIALQNFAFSRGGAALSLASPATIRFEGGTARFDRMVFRAGNGTVTLAGSAGEALDLRAEMRGLPAALANAVSPQLGAEGSISGTATVSGSAAEPAARFSAEWQGASVAASREAGLGPVAVSAQGALAGSSLSLESLIAGADGLAVRAIGSVGTAAGAPLDLDISGTVPLSLGNARLAARGAALEGALALDLSVTGPAAAPQFAGRVTSEGGGFIDPETGIVLRNLSLAASLSSNRLVIDRLTAQSGEGSVSASGSVGLGAGFPLDLAAQVRQARYVDGTQVATRFNADLTLSGSLAAGSVLGGSVFLDRTEINVPEQLPRDSVAVDVEHVNTPEAVSRTLGNIFDRSAPANGGSRATGVTLDLTIRAPQQIFVRGRGLDAELGGDLRLTGPISGIVADGAFEMRRGRLDIFTQRISFDRGVITFAGDLDPILDFSGSTQSGDVAVTVAIAGEASDPEITFSSVPELPQDEVLAHLIFERGIGELSPVQIARLADAAAGLGGGGGILNRLRASTGLDDLDIVTDEEGAPAVAAGRYISENVYIGVQGGASSESSKVTIDLDITDDVKARAAVTPQGNSSLGVFFEREY